jgi:uncharacterized membrane protein
MTMFRKNASAVKDNAIEATDLASELAQDEKFRNRLLSAVAHGAVARQRARRLLLFAAAARLARDEKLRTHVLRMTRDLQAVWKLVEKRRRPSHRVRNSLLVGAGGAVATAVAVPTARRWLLSPLSSRTNGGMPRVITAETEVAVPVSTAYNQWTQFEEFPQFMEGVEQVRQLDDTRLHWVANVGGKRAEWEAKILEQHPDEQVSWVSEAGKKTRGTVTFEPHGADRTLVRVSMSYQAEGAREAAGAVVGLDQRRVRGDLERFKQLIESRETPPGAWRGDISTGTTT